MLVAGEPSDPDVAAAVTVRPTVELSKFYVAARRGTARASRRALMAATLDDGHARRRPSASGSASTSRTRARSRFYEKHGFERVGTEHFRVGGRLEDDFVRERPLL